MTQQPHNDHPSVLTSLEDTDGLRCVDIIARPDGTFAFKEFRRDPEDGGRWTLIADYSRLAYPTKEEALRAAVATIPWLAQTIDPRP